MKRTSYDIVFFDTIGMPYTGKTPLEKGLGGSEFQVILLAEEIAASGRSVLVMNRTSMEATHNGVDYVPNHNFLVRSCDVLVIARYSAIPWITANRIIVWASDIPDGSYDHTNRFFYTHPDATLVCLSEWQRRLFPVISKSVVIPYMLPIEVYEFGAIENPKKFIYASAALKGLKETISIWREIVGEANPLGLELVVCSPGYDWPDIADMTAPGVRFLGNLPFADVVNEISNSAGLFYVNSFSETFCIVAALTEALRRRTHILCLTDQGALKETINSPLVTSEKLKFLNFFHHARQNCHDISLHGKAKDYRPKTILDKWLPLIEAK